MATPSLSDREISLIKTMLSRGMQNKTIQFYFNTPSRPVNNGRISEIKSGDKGAGVEPASEYEVDDFIEKHPLTTFEQNADDPQLPNEISVASVFTVTDEGLIDIQSSSPSERSIFEPEVHKIYEELRSKAIDLRDIGHNSLGAISGRVESFDAALPEDLGTASIITIWSRGNSLRAALRASDEVSKLGEPHPDQLEPGCVERLRDVVELFNIFVANDDLGVQLDRLKMGPHNREDYKKSINIVIPVIEASSEITTDLAEAEISEQVQAAANAPDTQEGNQALALGNNSTQNFLLSAIKYSYWHIKRQAGDLFNDLWKDYRKEGAVAAGELLLTNTPSILAYLKNNSTAIIEFFTIVSENPAVKLILNFVLGLI